MEFFEIAPRQRVYKLQLMIKHTKISKTICQAKLKTVLCGHHDCLLGTSTMTEIEYVWNSPHTY